MNYRFSDTETQDKLLRAQLVGHPAAVIMQAISRMEKRVRRFYQLDNKYPKQRG